MPLGVQAYSDVLSFAYGIPGAGGGRNSLRGNEPRLFLHFVVGRATEGIPAGSRPARIGGRSGVLASATHDGSLVAGPYFSNHVRFVWHENGIQYVATLHTFGEGPTEHLLDQIMRSLRPARELRATPPGASIRVTSVRVAAAPAGLALSPGGVWVASLGSLNSDASSSPQLVRVDPSTLAARDVSLGDTSLVVTADKTSIWAASERIVGNAFTPEVTQLDPVTGTMRARIRLGRGEVVGIAASANAVWVGTNQYSGGGNSDIATGTLWRVDPATKQPTARIQIPGGVGSLVATDSDVWATTYNGPWVARVDAHTNRALGRVRVGRRPYGIAAAAGALWVTNVVDGSVSRVEPRDMRTTATIPVGQAPYGITADARGLWIAVLGDGAIVRINPDTNRIDERLRIGGDPLALVSDGKNLWVTLNSDSRLLQWHDAIR
jgi:glutamine cyclotransferase